MRTELRNPRVLATLLQWCCIALLLGAWPTMAKDQATVRPQADLSQGLTAEGVTVRWAGFASGDRWEDLTDYCNTQLQDRGVIHCNSDQIRRRLPDTLIRGNGHVVLLLDTPGGLVHLRLTEGGMFSIKIRARDLAPLGPGRRWSRDQADRADRLLGQPDSGVGVVWAYWGSGRYGREAWVDLTADISDLLEELPFKSVERGLKQEIPYPENKRQIRLLLGCGGQAVYVFLPKHSEITTRPSEQQTRVPWQMRTSQTPSFAQVAADVDRLDNPRQWGLSDDGRSVIAVHPGSGNRFRLDPASLDIVESVSADKARQDGWGIVPRAELPESQLSREGVNGNAYSDYTLIDDGRYVLAQSGALYARGNYPAGMMRRYTQHTLPQNFGAVVSRELGVLAVFCRGQIKLYRWPELDVLSDVVHQGVLVDPRPVQGTPVFYARWLDNPPLNDLGKLVEDDTPGRIVRVDLSELVADDQIAPRSGLPEPVRGGATGHPDIARSLPLRSDLTDIAYSADGKSVYLLDAGAGCVYRINPQTLAIQEQTGRLPFGTHRMSLGPAGDVLWLACAPTAFEHNKDHPGGKVLRIDTTGGFSKVIEHSTGIDPFDIAAAGTRNNPWVFITDGSNQWTNMHEYGGNPLKQINQVGVTQRSKITVVPNRSLMFVGEYQSFGYISLVSPGHAKMHEMAASRNAREVFVSSDGSYVMTEASDLCELNHASKHRTTMIYRGHVGPRDRRWTPAPLDMIAGMEHCNGQLVVCDRLGQLWRINKQTLEATPGPVFKGILTDLRFDPQSGRLLAIYRHDAVISNHGSYKRPIYADFVSIDLKDWLETEPGDTFRD
ncbi:MAG: hypothetical protein AAGC72_14165 [Planctomycetota bacterium]